MKLARILDRLRTLRFKLALLYMTIFGTIQTALCISIIIVRERELHHEALNSLVTRGELIADTLDTDPVGSVPQNLLKSVSFIDYVVRISDDQGVLTLSDNIGGVPLPEVTDHTKRFHLLEGSESGQPSRQVLLYSFPHQTPDGHSLLVQIGRDFTELQKRMESLRKVVYFSLSTALVLSVLGSWYAAARSLSPIAEIARNAREIAATDLHRRLPVPRGSDEVVQMVHVLNQMLDRLEQAFFAHEKFNADISHELKTPLTELITEASVMIQRPRLPVEHEDFEYRVKERLKRLSEMVDSMLTLAQIESGLLPPIMSPVAVNDVVAECTQTYKGMANERGVGLVAHLAMPEADGEEPLVAGNPALLEIAVANLVRNAIRFTPKGKHVEVFVEPAEERVKIIVGDLGPGIPQAHINRIFDRYFTSGDSRPSGGGAGLGLAIARSIATLHQGTLVAANRSRVSGPGCLFTLSLPRLRAT